MFRIGKMIRSAKRKLITPPKLMPPFQSTTARGTFPTEQTQLSIEMTGPISGLQNSLSVGWLVRKNACHQEAQSQVHIQGVQVHIKGMRDCSEPARREEPGQKRPICDGYVHLAVGLMGRPENAASGLPLRIVDHPPAQGHLEEDPEDHSHQEAARKLRGDELPTQKDEQHEAELEDQVGGRELENDRVDEARPS